MAYVGVQPVYTTKETLYGFLPATEGSARGNYGLMDQVAALHWVQENIAEFGGDQKNVTIVGQGYGAAFVNLLMISPMAREMNRRFLYAMRTIGQGHAAMVTFCGVMDFPPPVAENSYNNIINKLQLCSKEVAEASMQSAALEEVTLTNSSDIIISGDGTWKTRGYSSRVGVFAVIGDKTGKCIDAEVMSSFCKGCDSWKRRKGSPAYKKCKILHVKECLKTTMVQLA
ncbi:uncharacterized protein TNCV_693281 [Trichonephila clavipes]|nr:uncharacterized protein TNCV_693281 [Trichonephila clavipes]